MTNPIGNFQKFEFWFHAGISTNTWWAEIYQNRIHCGQQWLAALALVSDLPAVPWPLPCRSPVSPAQTTAMRHGWHGGRTHRTPHLPPPNQTTPQPTIAPGCSYSTQPPAAHARTEPCPSHGRHTRYTGRLWTSPVLPLPTIKSPLSSLKRSAPAPAPP
jgi:hypothetical protein